MTLFEKIKSMSIEEMAEKAVKFMKIMVRNGCYVSLLDTTVYDTKEQAIAHNKKILKKKYTEGGDGQAD